MKAEIIYKNGWLLNIPKEGNASMLFLEWIEDFNAAKCPLHKVINEGEYLSIRLTGTKQDYYDSAAKYINDNL